MNFHWQLHKKLEGQVWVLHNLLAESNAQAACSECFAGLSNFRCMVTHHILHAAMLGLYPNLNIKFHTQSLEKLKWILSIK